jgi:nucleoside 2-deoxyribosyltransferase
MKIYFAGSIRGGRDDAKLYQQIIARLSAYGEVLTEHVGSGGITSTGEKDLDDEVIFERDMAWLMEADVVVAEVSMPSHGVGYEIASAEAAGKPVLCLYRSQPDRRLSAMLGGNSTLRCETYEAPKDLETILNSFLQR